MKRPRDAAGQLANELAAMNMLDAATPEWIELFHQVREFLQLDARARSGNLPADNKRAYTARAELSYVVNTLADAERDKDVPVTFDWTKAEGGAS